MKSSARTTVAPARSSPGSSTGHERALGREWFTTGQIAKFMGIAMRTASKLIDSGEIAGTRIGQDRRVHRDTLTKYLNRKNVPLPPCLTPPARITVGHGELADLLPVHWFDLGQVLATRPVGVAVIGTTDGLWLAIDAAKRIRAADAATRMVLVLGEDQTYRDTAGLFAAIAQQPIPAGDLLAILSEVQS